MAGKLNNRIDGERAGCATIPTCVVARAWVHSRWSTRPVAHFRRAGARSSVLLLAWQQLKCTSSPRIWHAVSFNLRT